MTEVLGEPGQFHRNLVKNNCPKCEKPLTFVAITDGKLHRKCKTCNLTIVDPLEAGEYPPNICEICD